LSLYFKTQGKVSTENPNVKINGENVSINLTMPSITQPLEYSFKAGTQTIRVLAMNRQLTDKTYIDKPHNTPYIICGADYIGEIGIDDHPFTAEIERPLLKDKTGRFGFTRLKKRCC
jgi:beta-galactosidase